MQTDFDFVISIHFDFNSSVNSIVFICFQLLGGLCNTLMKVMQTFIFEDIFNQSLLFVH